MIQGYFFLRTISYVLYFVSADLFAVNASVNCSRLLDEYYSVRVVN